MKEKVEDTRTMNKEKLEDVKQVLRPCLWEWVQAGEDLPHWKRHAIMCELRAEGFQKEDVKHVFEHFQLTNPEQVDQLYEVESSPSQCETIQEKGGCLGAEDCSLKTPGDPNMRQFTIEDIMEEFVFVGRLHCSAKELSLSIRKGTNTLDETIPYAYERVEELEAPHPNSSCYKKVYNPVLRTAYEQRENDSEFTQFRKDVLPELSHTVAKRVMEQREEWKQSLREDKKREEEAEKIAEERKQEAIEFLQQDDVLEQIEQLLSYTVKRDEIGKRLVFTTALSTYNKEPLNLFLTGPPSTGKSYLLTNIVKFFPEQDVLFLGGLSPTALVHGEGEWDEEREAKVVDLENKILAFLESPSKETFETLLPILSHDKWEISFKYTDKTEDGQLEQKTSIIRGWPATIFCSYEPEYFKALNTRGFKYTPEMSGEKYEAGQKLKATEVSELAWSDKIREKTKILNDVIRVIKEYAKDAEVVVPYAHALEEKFPAEKGEDMRTFNQIMYLNQALAFVHLFKTPIIQNKEEEKRYLLAGSETYHKSRKMVNSVVEQKTLPGYLRNFLENVLKPAIKEFGIESNDLRGKKRGVHREDVQKMYYRKNNERLGKSTLSDYIQYLEDAGFVTDEKDPTDRRKKITFLLTENGGTSSKKFNEQFLELYPRKAFNRWIKKNCSTEGQILVRHPTHHEGGGRGVSLVQGDLSNNYFRGCSSTNSGGEGGKSFDEQNRTSSKTDSGGEENDKESARDDEGGSSDSGSSPVEVRGDREDTGDHDDLDVEQILAEGREEGRERVREKKPSTKKEKFTHFCERFRYLQEERNGEYVTRLMLYEETELTNEEVDEFIKREKKRGGIYEPKQNQFKLVPG